MYQSYQARIKKKNPSLLPGRGQGLRPASSRTLSPSYRHNIRVNSTHGYCRTPATV